MSLDADIHTRLLADGAVSALVGARGYSNILPQNPTYPAYRLQLISAPELFHLDGAAGMQMPRFQIDSYGATYADAKDLADAVRASLNGFIGTLSGLRVTIKKDNERDDFDETVEKHRVIQDYMFTRSEN